MSRRAFRVISGILLWAFLSVFVTQGSAQKPSLPGTEKAPAVGAQAPLFSLEGFELKRQLERGPIVVVFYRGFF